MARGKPAPELFLHASAGMRKKPAECIVVEDSPLGVAAGMTVIGFVGGSRTGSQLGDYLRSAGAALVINDMRALKSSVIDLRGW